MCISTFIIRRMQQSYDASAPLESIVIQGVTEK